MSGLQEKMLAAVYHGPNDLRVERVPVPKIADDEVLLRVLATNICGTDLRILHGGHRKFPTGVVRIPGHETVGEVAEVGSAVSGFRTGQRVFVAPNIGLGSSRETISGNNNLDPNYEAIGVTMDGAFAEYVRIPGEFVRQGNLMPISEQTDPAVAALVEPLACVLRGQNAVNVAYGDVVVIMGAGPIGILHLLLARLRGAGSVIISEPSEARRRQATALGADRVVDPIRGELEPAVLEASNGRGADVIIVAAPSKPAQESALQIAAIGGRINLFGGLPKDDPIIRFDSNAVHYKELVVTGTTACSTYDCVRAADLVNFGRMNLSPLVTSRFPLGQTAEAFAAAVDGINLRVALIPE
jgi:L-iditol 2-dehydrogenase